MKHNGKPRRTAIFPITIQSPFGELILAYRVQDGKLYGKPFFVEADLPCILPGAAELWADMAGGLDDLMSDLWWMALPPEKRAELEGTGPLILTEKGKSFSRA